MDKQKAVDLLDNLVGFVGDSQGNDYDTALKMGIKALQGDPDTVDMISRQAAIDAADKIIERDTSGNNDVVKAMTAWKEYVKGLPSAHPDLSEYSDKLWKSAYERGKAQPQRIRGRWVEVTDCISIWKVCNQCGEKPLWNEWRTDRYESNYCPNCGADMREEQDG